MAVHDLDDAMLQQLLSFPNHPDPAQIPDLAYEEGIRRVTSALHSIPASKLTKSISGSDTILDIIDPSINTLPYLHALLATARADSGDAAVVAGTPLYSKTTKFLSEFDPVQVRYSGHQFRELLSLALKGAGDNKQDLHHAIHTVSLALLRLDPQGATLTSLHLAILELCLKARDYSSPLTLLDQDVFHLPSPSGHEPTFPPYLCSKHQTSAGFVTEKSGLTTSLSYQDYLKYFLYGASIYIANKRWQRALHFLEIVLSAPVHGQSFSMVQVEAYKKWCLVHLLVHGRGGHPQRNMIQPVARHCQNLAKPYIVVADMFKDTDSAKLKAEVEIGPFKADCNYGLLMFVLAAHRRSKISKLANTYSSLSAREVARLAGVAPSAEETVKYLQSLISEGEIDAVLSRPTSSSDPGDLILTFDAYNGGMRKSHELYDAQIDMAGRLAAVQQHMASTQKHIELSKEYIAVAKKQRKAEENTKGGKGNAMIDDDDTFGDDL